METTATEATHFHTCNIGRPCAACELEAFKLALAKLATREFNQWLNLMAPRCPKWARLLSEGPAAKDIGTLAASFVKVKAVEQSR